MRENMNAKVLVLLLTLSVFVCAEEKVYLSLDKLSFTEKGIFFKKGECIVQLPSVGYDEHGYYLASNSKNGVTVIQCAACRYYTWWVEKHCCMREECVYYCY
jgi:hypothetical protein